jgi:hypothetical protein
MSVKLIGRQFIAEEDEDSPFNPIRGIVIGVALSLILWAVIIGGAIYALMD